MGNRGGMSANPFGGCDHKEAEPGRKCPICGIFKNIRLDRLDLEQGTIVKGERETLIYLYLITREIHNYLYFCLGNNGTTPDKFLEAYRYLFLVRSDRPETWGSRLLKTQRLDVDGRLQNSVVQLTDEEMRLGCFDVQYELSGMQDVMHIERFERWLQERRAAILRENLPQFLAYLDELRAHELNTISQGRQLPLWAFGTDDPMRVMVAPETFRQLAQMIYLPEDLKHPLPERKRPGIRVRRKTACEEISLGAPHGILGEPPDLRLSLV